MNRLIYHRPLLSPFYIIYGILNVLGIIEDASIERPRRTEVIHGIENSLRIGLEFMQNAKTLDVVADKTGPSILIENDFYKANLIELVNRGGIMRYLADITKDNLHYCKEMLLIAGDMRHFEGFTGGLAVSNLAYMGTPALREKQHSVFLIYSNEKEIVEQQQILFNTIWEKAIPAKQRIKEIELGVKREFAETIRDPVEIQKLFSKLLEFAEKDILLLLSTANTFRRIEKLDVVAHLIKSASQGKNVRLLLDSDTSVEIIKEKYGKGLDQIEYRKLLKSLRSFIISLIVDESLSLVIDIKNDSQENFEESIGLGTYTNIESTVDTYLSLFERGWYQAK